MQVSMYDFSSSILNTRGIVASRFSILATTHDETTYTKYNTPRGCSQQLGRVKKREKKYKRKDRFRWERKRERRRRKGPKKRYAVDLTLSLHQRPAKKKTIRPVLVCILTASTAPPSDKKSFFLVLKICPPECMFFFFSLCDGIF